VTVVTSEEIKTSGAHSLPDLLDRLPGIDLSRSGSLVSFLIVQMRKDPTNEQINAAWKIAAIIHEELRTK
jgi:hypothetical protein